ncbi:hypothetical protein CERSUDRAFT_102355 [Gelatoporia subvermispora B]|uniref:DUF605-domain-containing protein n=1 Tax=Ceriporiopsis subvermispora (strain B) TaxID=914234 RepID=M2PYK4_CERS8|nr:hypothetical protein CERSUDRAFT_102355 [Gelatoporia subvermispora B]
MSSLLNLPPVPPELKNIAPFLQRADELLSKEPVVSYWAAYYAAQMGIALKPKEHASRTFLGKLLGLLEQMKTDIGPSDAIENEAVSSAYIENFGLRVFAAADNEDRKGAATRATAKKFLAAASFLEILRVFDSDAVGQTAASANEEKIRYAKWKAADIAKAFREGRKPTPGPAVAEAPTTPTEPTPDSHPSFSLASGTPSPPSIVRTKTPPPPLTDISSQSQPDFQTPVRGPPSGPGAFLHPGGGTPDPQSPGRWSTVATPGTPGRFAMDDDGPHTTHVLSPTPSRLPHAMVSRELEGRPEDEWEDVDADAPPAGSASPLKAVRFTPSTMGDLSGAGPSTPAHPTEDPFSVRVVVDTPTDPGTGFPSGFVPTEISPHPDALPLDDLPPGFVPSPRAFTPQLPPHTPPPPPPSLPSPPRTQARFSPAPPPPPVLYSHGAAPVVHPVARRAPGPPPPARFAADETVATNVPVQLTPALISRVQKHCRFAVSSLDYEDAEQAKKELRMALQLLGG